MQIRNRVFVVTGATSGLGAAVVRTLLHHGGKVVATGRDVERGRDLIFGYSDAVFVPADVTSEQDACKVFDAALINFARVDGLINCAGVAHGERVVGRDRLHSLDTFAHVVKTNLVGTFNMIRQAAEQIAANEADHDGERGVIVNVASIAAFEGQIGQAAYAASKGGIVSMTLPIARELAPKGIRVVTIAPGVFRTPMIEGFREDIRQGLAASVPFPQRLGEPEEFAQLVQAVIENRMLNGCTIRLDGALRMGAR